MANALFCRPPLGSAHRRLSKMDGQVKCAEATSLTGRLRSNDKIIAVSSPFPNLEPAHAARQLLNGRASSRLWIPQCGTRRTDVLRLLNAKVPNHVVRMGFDEITVRHKK